MKTHGDYYGLFRSRYYQKFYQHLGAIPDLPQNYGNANDRYQLLAWLHRAFKHLLDDFVQLELEFEQFKKELLETLEILIPSLIREYTNSKEFYEKIIEIINGWYEKYLKEIIEQIQKDIRDIREKIKEIIERIEKIEKEIKEIKDRLTQIEKTLEGILGGGYTKLKKGVDYEVKFHNGFSTQSNDITVSVIELYDRYMVKFSATNDDKTYLEHKNLNNITLRHSQPIEDAMESNIFSIKFIGKYADINSNSQVINASGEGLWNVRPFNLRASWNLSYGRSRNLFSGYPITICGVSYADGYNTDFKIYKSEDIYLDGGNLQYNVTFKKA